MRDVDAKAFSKVLDMWCGRDVEVKGREDVQELAFLADRFQIPDVLSLLEDTMMGLLDVDVCADVLSWSGKVGLSRLKSAARYLAVKRFAEFAVSSGFCQIEEETLGESTATSWTMTS